MSGGTLTGAEIAELDDARLSAAAAATATATATILARAEGSPRPTAADGHDVGFLGDGVNDPLALYAADVGLSVDTAADVAKTAPTSSCWKGRGYSPTASPRPGGSSRVPSSTS